MDFRPDRAVKYGAYIYAETDKDCKFRITTDGNEKLTVNGFAKKLCCGGDERERKE